MSSVIAAVIEPRARDLGGFEVRRVLPSGKRRMVGPFIFFDHMGPVRLPAGKGIDVRPHPHIGLATVTYLFEGELVHRDSLGYVQRIQPGDVNWMTAGSGIVHSERSDAEARSREIRMHGIQSWVALPQAVEEIEPSFHHHASDSLPLILRDDVCMRLIVGTAFGQESPVKTFSDMFYLDAQLADDCVLVLPPEHAERAIYVANGAIAVAGERFETGVMVVCDGGVDIEIRAHAETRLMLLGGAPFDGPRHIWWNFVSSSKQRIEQAKTDWQEGRFASVPGETEFVPLPEG